MKKVAQRSCMGCNEKKDKSELIRIVKPKDGDAIVDKNGKTSGRGAYICYNEKCLEKLKKNNKLGRVLKTNISKKIYEEIRGVMLEQGK